jgi:hypothetical protein
MAKIDFLQIILLLLVIYLIFKVNRLSKSVSSMTATPVVSKSMTTSKVQKPTNKFCPISGLPVDHPGAETSVVDLPNGNKVSVCSHHCKEKVQDLFHKYG